MSSPEVPIDDDAIAAVVTRLARPHGEGGHVIERAAILAAGPDSAAIEAWILAHAGLPEVALAASPSGLHGHRITDTARQGGAPRRYLIPVGVLAGAKPSAR